MTTGPSHHPGFKLENTLLLRFEYQMPKACSLLADDLYSLVAIDDQNILPAAATQRGRVYTYDGIKRDRRRID